MREESKDDNTERKEEAPVEENRILKLLTKAFQGAAMKPKGRLHLDGLTKFKGTENEDVLEWILRLERHGKVLGWNDEDKRSALLLQLDESAYLWSIGRKVEDQYHTYLALREALYTEYTDPNIVSKTFEDYRRCRWGGHGVVTNTDIG